MNNTAKPESKGQEPQQPRQGFPYWGLFWGILIAIIINMLFPIVGTNRIVPADYGTFISKVDSGLVKAVVIEDRQILFQTASPDGKADSTFQTGAMDDPQLVERLINASSPNKDGKIIFTKKIQKENSALMNFILLWLLPCVIMILVWRSVTRTMRSRMNGGGMGNFMSFGSSGARIYAESQIKTTFADVAGQEEAKEALKEIVEFLHNPEKYRQIGANLPKGALLVGPPGTGKTLIARAVAGEANVPFFSISGSEFVQMFVGMGATKVRDLFKQAGEKAPCIIFIDEIDAIGKKRENSIGGNDEREQTLNQLLTEMDGFDGNKGVVILAATNRPESLDKALLRPGRFDRRIQMELPDLEGRKAILSVHLNKVRHDDIDLDIVARATSGSSGAEIANIVNEAALRAVRMGRSSVTTADLEESVETVMAGAQRKNKVISDTEKKIVAYHEIGHALVAAMQTDSAPVHKITIVPRTSGALGYTMQVDTEDQVLMSRNELLNRIATLTGGRAAEEVVCGTVTTGASNDIGQATRIARAMVTRYGMSGQYDMMELEPRNSAYLGGDPSLACSPATAAEVDKAVLGIIKDAHAKARKLISDNLDIMHEAAGLLMEKETITGEEFMEIVKRRRKAKE